MTESKKRLLELEKIGEYFFHGSPNEVEIFEPRQSHNDIKGNLVPDGEPAVSASPSVDYAVFMAIFNLENCPKGFTSRVNVSSDTEFAETFQLSYLATKEALEQLNDDSTGWVYVFNKKDFPFKKGPAEYRSLVHVEPLERLLVKREDLPEVSEFVASRDLK